MECGAVDFYAFWCTAVGLKRRLSHRDVSHSAILWLSRQDVIVATFWQCFLFQRSVVTCQLIHTPSKYRVRKDRPYRPRARQTPSSPSETAQRLVQVTVREKLGQCPSPFPHPPSYNAEVI